MASMTFRLGFLQTFGGHFEKVPTCFHRFVVHFVTYYGYNVDRWSFQPTPQVSRQTRTLKDVNGNLEVRLL